jgi:hypothetical protein
MPLFDLDDDDPPNDGWTKWGLGLAIPLLLGLFGLSRIIIQHATVYHRGHFVRHVSGREVIASGILLVAVSVFMHGRYYMPNSKGMGEFAGLVKVVALAVFIVAGAFLLVYRVSPI